MTFQWRQNTLSGLRQGGGVSEASGAGASAGWKDNEFVDEADM